VPGPRHRAEVIARANESVPHRACREKQQRPALSPTAVIRLRCFAKYEANARPQYEDRAGDVTSTSSSSSPSSWPWLTSFSPDDIEVGWESFAGVVFLNTSPYRVDDAISEMNATWMVHVSWRSKARA
jgi:hypothetical protein